MSGVGTPRQEQAPIGKIAEPPFVRLPDAKTLFTTRAGRLRALSEGHPLAAYLSFLASLSDVQHRLQDGLVEPVLPSDAGRERAREFGMPPLDRSRFTADAAFSATLDR